MPMDHLSFATTPVVAISKERPLWQGSGFFYLYQHGENRVLYLVTNYHVLSGQAPGQKQQPVADEIVFQFHTDADTPSEVRPVRVPLFTRQGRKVWLESEAVAAADVVAIPVPAHVCEGCVINCLDRSWAEPLHDGLSPMAPIHVVGFPYGYHDQENALPVWQAGALASDPAVAFDGQPQMAVDLPAYPGMSGAPAMALGYRTLPGQPQGQLVRQFLGIYASLPIAEDGRFPEAFCVSQRPGVLARDASQWGRIWRASVVEDLVSAVDTERWEREVLADLA